MQRRPSSSQLKNLRGNVAAFALRRQRAAKLPSLVKIDISPLCSLACSHCLHADPKGRGKDLLSAQRFEKSDKISIADYARIIDQIRGKAVAVSLFYYGDPLIHPDIDAIIRTTSEAGIETHITTHFSYKFSKERLKRLAEAGLSHITVAVDGATQESYATTRVRGRLDFVLDNLRMLAEIKRETGSKTPFIEVQHIRFPHHAPDELKRVRAIVDEIGVNHFTSFEGLRFDDDGDLYNVVDDDADTVAVGPPKGFSPIPRCHWPYSGTVIRHDGDVIPCCLWRTGRQFVAKEERDPHVLGNVFETPLEKIWNSEKYKSLRRQVSNPRSALSEPGRGPTFCDGCPRLHVRPKVAADIPEPHPLNARPLADPLPAD
jgi:MoaA/NifB/PqqE/SkfB family radical SAM enzyme